jgi:diguanylate cyclase (GGDEF)-like protein
MIQRAEEEISRFHRFHTTASLIVIELIPVSEDRDAIEPAAREEALKAVATNCLNTVREVDVVSRFSGEQFIILCPQTELKAAKTLADRLLECTSTHHTIVTNFKTAMGLSELRESEEFTEWFERTMKALYQSKRQGYGNVSVAQ